ncbi:MAG: trypsin-like peptidase domain-containing protein [Polyangiaceae bacterium]|nr:trypsin-like peptidase domain-containing protein [Polyangiaceae bacterium]
MSWPTQSEVDRLLRRITTAFGEEPVATAIPRRKQIVFMNPATAVAEGAVVDEVAAQRAADAVRRSAELMARNEIPDVSDLPRAADLAALEVCIRFMRPALYVKGDRIAGAQQLKLSDTSRKAIEALLPGIGSIGFPESRKGVATGFLVGRRALATNIHVIRAITTGKQPRPLTDAVVRFDVEWDELERWKAIRVVGEIVRHPTLDWALLELAEDGPRPGLPLDGALKSKPNDRLLVVGHPNDDWRTPTWAKAMYAGNWGVKRVSPGAVLRADDELLLHDASTLGGNSGSPVIDAESGRVVGIHAEGVWALENTAVRAGTATTFQAMDSAIESWVARC